MKKSFTKKQKATPEALDRITIKPTVHVCVRMCACGLSLEAKVRQKDLEQRPDNFNLTIKLKFILGLFM